jgi:DNA adenine methylase
MTDILKDIKITNLDYSELLFVSGQNILIFFDPPYFCATRSRLYGKDGNLHISFKHQRFFDLVKKCQYQWLITYDNSPEIRKNFDLFNLVEWELQYGMNNYKQSYAARGKELIITNYKIPKDYQDFNQLSLDLSD